MKINFDGKIFEVLNQSDNIVEIAEKNGTYIAATCFRNKKINGCCNGCLIIVDGKEQYACTTKPYDGMTIVYDREDLQKKRKDILQRYVDNIKDSATDKNSCCSTNTQKQERSCRCNSDNDSCDQ